MRASMLASVLLLLSACDPTTSASKPSASDSRRPVAAQGKPAPVAGKAIYEQYCVACHGVDGKGNHGLGGDYRKVLHGRDDAELIASIKHGKRGEVGAMPPWGAILSDAAIREVLDYIKTEYGPGSDDSPAAEPPPAPSSGTENATEGTDPSP